MTSQTVSPRVASPAEAAGETGLPPGSPSEEWRPLVGWEGRYSVSNLGRVRNDKRGTIRKPGVSSRYGHLSLVFWDNHLPHTVWVHRAVLEAFVGPCPPGHETRHLNGDAGDNRLANLAWGTPGENSDDRLRHGTRARGQRIGMAKLTERDVLDIFELRSGFDSAAEVARWFDVTAPTVRSIWTGKTWGWLTNA